MELLSIITNILLAGLTALYVIVTKRILDTAVAANQQTKVSFRENQRVQVFPQLFCYLNKDDQKQVLILQNPSDNVASDLDLFILGVYSVEDISPDQFVNDFIRQDTDIEFKIVPTDEGFFTLFHHFTFSFAPPHSQCKVDLSLPISPDAFYVFLQFRDVLGNNYFRFYWMFSFSKEEGRYRIGDVEPCEAKTCSRIEHDFREDKFILYTRSNETLPIEVEHSDFIGFFQNAISTGFLKNSIHQIEDPGEWQPL
ncbi:MAG: hypothetical protein ACLQDF_15620 [Desulfomonilia bacterium]